MKLLIQFQILALIMTLVACNSSTGDKTLKTPSGYEYVHFKTDGTIAQPGEYVSFTMNIVGSDGSLLQEIKEGPAMPVMQVAKDGEPAGAINPIGDILKTVSVGDSVSMIMPLDSMPNAKFNPLFQNMDHVKYNMVIKKIQDEKTYNESIELMRMEMAEKAAKLKERLPEVEQTVESLLEDYNKGKLKLKKTKEGLEYVILEEGTGDYPVAEQQVSVQYYGTLMDGKPFDNSFKRGQAFTFNISSGQVIKGWDIGIPLMKEGSKGALFIPYELAYGEAGSPPNIPGKSNLLFYVELEEIK